MPLEEYDPTSWPCLSLHQVLNVGTEIRTGGKPHEPLFVLPTEFGVQHLRSPHVDRLLIHPVILLFSTQTHWRLLDLALPLCPPFNRSRTRSARSAYT